MTEDTAATGVELDAGTEDTGATGVELHAGIELEVPAGPAGVEEDGDAVCQLSVNHAGMNRNETTHNCDRAAHSHCLGNYPASTTGRRWKNSDSGSGR